MKRSLLAFAAAAALLCLRGTPAWATPITTTTNIGWSYNFTPSQSFVSADPPGSGTVSFTNEPTKTATNSSDVVVTNLRVSSTASPNSPDTLSTNGAWKVGLTLTDSASGASNTMMFSGQLSGTFSASNSNIANQFTGQTTFTWTAPAVNGTADQYTVTLTGYTPPGPPTASNAGSISAHISVTAEGGISGTGTPEPSTLVLSVLGLGFAGVASWRKRRRSLAAMLA